MKSLLTLTSVILEDSGIKCGADPSRDIITVTRRTKQEGDSFLTITLPSFCSAFERALAEGRLTPSMTPGFRWHRRGLPAFLQGFLSQVFGPDGRLLQKPNVTAIECIRQICLLHKKVLRDCTEKRKRDAVRSYLECENDVETAQSSCEGPYWETFKRTAAIIWSDTLRRVPFGNIYGDLRPKHGPGTTQERVLGNAKYSFKSWFSRLESAFPFSEFGGSSLRAFDFGQALDHIDVIEPENEPPVRVVFVPKTLKTPRVIAIEPVCMQYMQQAILRELVPMIESAKFTGGRVNFTHQSVNRKLALESSHNKRLATLDMKEASDRVSLKHVQDMLAVAPALYEQVMACRSTRAELPTGEVISLKKFASMGSALCFPMEAMVFFTAIVSSRIHRAKLPVTSRRVYKYSRDVYVYGDDIIVPADEAPSVCEDLEAIGLKVNKRKSFWTGSFRESCGMDAYDGTEVTPTYCRRDVPSDRRDAEGLASWVSMANQFYLKGFWKTARAIRSHIESILGKLPFGTNQAVGLCWISYSNAITHNRWNKDLHAFETRMWTLKPSKRSDIINDEAAFLKCILNVGSDTHDKDHLTHSVARGRLALKSRWAPSL